MKWIVFDLVLAAVAFAQPEFDVAVVTVNKSGEPFAERRVLPERTIDSISSRKFRPARRMRICMPCNQNLLKDRFGVAIPMARLSPAAN